VEDETKNKLSMLETKTVEKYYLEAKKLLRASITLLRDTLSVFVMIVGRPKNEQKLFWIGIPAPLA
jgi:hypothetical protein